MNRFLILGLILALPALSARADDVCDPAVEYVRNGVILSPEPGVKALAHVIPKDVQVVLIGEDHHDFESRAIDPEILKTLFPARPAAGCLFLEFTRDHQSYFDELQNPGASLDEIALRLRDRIFADAGEKLENANPVKKERMLLNVTAWLQAAKAASALGLKVETMDVQEFPKLALKLPEPELDEVRNRFMAGRIEEALKSGRCERIVTINGASHLVRGTVDGKSQTLTEKIRANGRKTHSILHATRFKHILREYFSASFCEELSDELTKHSGWFLLNNETPSIQFFYHMQSEIPPSQRKPFVMDRTTSLLLRITPW